MLKRVTFDWVAAIAPVCLAGKQNGGILSLQSQFVDFAFTPRF